MFISIEVQQSHRRVTNSKQYSAGTVVRRYARSSRIAIWRRLFLSMNSDVNSCWCDIAISDAIVRNIAVVGVIYGCDADVACYVTISHAVSADVSGVDLSSDVTGELMVACWTSRVLEVHVAADRTRLFVHVVDDDRLNWRISVNIAEVIGSIAAVDRIP